MDGESQIEKAVVLEMPPEVWEPVIKLRGAFDQDKARFPVEITLVGSSGVGPISSGQSSEEVIAAVQHAFKYVGPVRFRFSEITHFPSTCIYYLAPEDRTVFDRLHRLLLGSGLRYEECPFPYTPHCTICDMTGRTKEEIRQIQTLAYPKRELEITKVSLWSFKAGFQSLQRFHEIELSPTTGYTQTR